MRLGRGGIRLLTVRIQGDFWEEKPQPGARRRRRGVQWESRNVTVKASSRFCRFSPGFHRLPFPRYPRFPRFPLLPLCIPTPLTQGQVRGWESKRVPALTFTLKAYVVNERSSGYLKSNQIKQSKNFSNKHSFSYQLFIIIDLNLLID